MPRADAIETVNVAGERFYGLEVVLLPPVVHTQHAAAEVAPLATESHAD